MADEPSLPKPERGLTAELLSMWGSAARHVQALLELAGVEGREALGLYLRLAVLLGVALVFLFVGYLFALVFVVALAASLLGVSWIWISLAFAIIHLLVCFLCALHVKTHFNDPVFTTTSAELRKDFDALKAVRS
jgi:uncharacterized membrane protein YqjE